MQHQLLVSLVQGLGLGFRVCAGFLQGSSMRSVHVESAVLCCANRVKQ